METTEENTTQINRKKFKKRKEEGKKTVYNSKDKIKQKLEGKQKKKFTDLIPPPWRITQRKYTN